MEHFKLEAGKFYRTLDGNKAFVTGVSPFDSQLFSGFIEGKFDCARTWRPTGNAVDGGSDWNIVAEWVEPKRIKVWVNIFTANGTKSGYRVGSITHPSKEAAHETAAGMVATVEIDVLEGQGLDGSANNG